MFVLEHNPLNPLTLHAVNTCEFDENVHLIRAGILAGQMRLAGFVDVAIRYRVFFPHAFAALHRLEIWIPWLPISAPYYAHGRTRQ